MSSRRSPADANEEEDCIGCLAAIDAVNEEEARAEIAFRFTNRADVNERLLAYQEAEDLEIALDELTGQLRDCHTVTDTDGEALPNRAELRKS